MILSGYHYDFGLRAMNQPQRPDIIYQQSVNRYIDQCKINAKNQYKTLIIIFKVLRCLQNFRDVIPIIKSYIFHDIPEIDIIFHTDMRYVLNQLIRIKLYVMNDVHRKNPRLKKCFLIDGFFIHEFIDSYNYKRKTNLVRNQKDIICDAGIYNEFIEKSKINCDYEYIKRSSMYQ
jgi:hypothetical protein